MTASSDTKVSGVRGTDFFPETTDFFVIAGALCKQSSRKNPREFLIVEQGQGKARGSDRESLVFFVAAVVLLELLGEHGLHGWVHAVAAEHPHVDVAVALEGELVGLP